MNVIYPFYVVSAALTIFISKQFNVFPRFTKLIVSCTRKRSAYAMRHFLETCTFVTDVTCRERENETSVVIDVWMHFLAPVFAPIQYFIRQHNYSFNTALYAPKLSGYYFLTGINDSDENKLVFNNRQMLLLQSGAEKAIGPNPSFSDPHPHS